MIRIIKPADGPPELAEGMALVEAHEAARQADPKAGIPQKADPKSDTPKIIAFKFCRQTGIGRSEARTLRSRSAIVIAASTVGSYGHARSERCDPTSWPPDAHRRA